MEQDTIDTAEAQVSARSNEDRVCELTDSKTKANGQGGVWFALSYVVEVDSAAMAAATLPLRWRAVPANTVSRLMHLIVVTCYELERAEERETGKQPHCLVLKCNIPPYFGHLCSL